MTTPSPTEGDTPTPTPQAGSGDASTGQAPADANGTAAKGMTLEEAQRVISDLRKESAAARVKLNAFEKAQQEADAAKLSDIEKANKKAADAEAKILAQRTRIASLAVESAARALGIIDPELAALAIAKDLDIDDDGNPTNADALLKKLTTDKPYLLAPTANGRTPVSSGGATKPSASSASASNDLSWDVIGKMTPAEYEARNTTGEVTRWINANWNRR